MKNLICLLAFIATTFLFSSCEKEEQPTINEIGPNFATEVAGIYEGSILHGGTLYLDYQVTVEAIGHNKVRCQGEDDKLPVFTQEIVEAPEIVQEDWIIQPDTYQTDSVFTYTRDEQHLSIIRKEFDASFGGGRIQ